MCSNHTKQASAFPLSIRGLVIFLFVAVSLAGCIANQPMDDPMLRGPDALISPTVQEIHVEIDHAPGLAPSKLALDGFRASIEEVLPGKEIRFSIREQISMNEHGTNADEIFALHRAYRDEAPPGVWQHEGDTKIHVLYLAGDGELDGRSILGLTYRGQPLIVMFAEQLRGLFGDLPGGGQWDSFNQHYVERGVLVHEFGHLLGLVGCGIPMVQDHADAEETCHSRFGSSVMFHGAGSSQGWMELVQENQWVPYRFNAYEAQDIRAHQARLASS